jgi:chaperonin GroES
MLQEVQPMKIRPLHDRVLIKRLEEEEKSKGGIIIPDTAKEKPIQGKVFAVGTGKIMKNSDVIPLDVKKGEKVLFGRYAGTEVKIDGEEYLLMREDDILAVVQE